MLPVSAPPACSPPVPAAPVPQAFSPHAPVSGAPMAADPAPPGSPGAAPPATARLARAPGVRTLASPRFRLLIAITLAFLGVAILGAAMVRQAGQPAGQFAIDFRDYLGAAQALAASGHPYAPEMLAGPVDAQGVERYRYPPPLAQLLVPFANIPAGAVATAWLVLQAAAMVAAVWLALGAAGVPRHAERAAWSVVACLGFMPVFDTLWKGNVSGFVALAVSLVALGGATAGIGAMGGTLLKVVPATFLPLLLVQGRRALLAAGACAVAVVGVSFVAAPDAWWDYVRVLPNLLGGSADYATNLAPATMARLAGLPEPLPGLARAATLGLACAATLGAPLVAWRRRGTFAGRAAGATLAASAMLLLPAAAWYHYLAALLPIAALAWPAATPSARLALLGSAALVVAGVAVLPSATLGATLMVVVALGVHLRRAADRGTAGERRSADRRSADSRSAEQIPPPAVA